MNATEIMIAIPDTGYRWGVFSVLAGVIPIVVGLFIMATLIQFAPGYRRPKER